MSNTLTFNGEVYNYEYNNTEYREIAVRLLLPNDHWIAKFIERSNEMVIKMDDGEYLPYEGPQRINDDFLEKYQRDFKYELNYGKKPIRYFQPDYKNGMFTRIGKIVENNITKIGWFVYSDDEIESSVQSILNTLEAIKPLKPSMQIKEELPILDYIKNKVETSDCDNDKCDCATCFLKHHLCSCKNILTSRECNRCETKICDNCEHVFSRTYYCKNCFDRYR
jgi:hypothetical protein